MKNKRYIILIALAMLLCFLLGRCSNENEKIAKTKEVVKYVPSPYPIYDTIYEIKPYEIVKYKYDTIFLKSKQDTDNVVKDYFTTKKYELDFSNDTLGIFKVNTEVSMNELISASSFIQPKIKTITKDNTLYKVKPLQLYTTLGSSFDLKTNRISVGVDVNQKYLIGISGVRFSDNFSYTLDVGIKW